MTMTMTTTMTTTHSQWSPYGSRILYNSSWYCVKCVRNTLALHRITLLSYVMLFLCLLEFVIIWHATTNGACAPLLTTTTATITITNSFWPGKNHSIHSTFSLNILYSVCGSHSMDMIRLISLMGNLNHSPRSEFRMYANVRKIHKQNPKIAKSL